ncbi:hypothetical protein [Pasteurella atlantica]|uniref:hypothetical protein n=1 Tax=Pasteurellaceae TaxID=712 RepID=UPI00275F82CB|nr:hypothetical protein [Pasteurella atlantica]MDP8099886.1 hypothetical protein [Pasteurella atlantica]MDP8107732.1 hypothetical protein [Pasteurella atlantica]MDP8117499.1 hypothetical protein [Pasteurella atlantica]
MKQNVIYFTLGFVFSYCFLFLSNLLFTYLFVYLEKGIFPITLDDFLWPIRPSLIAIGVHVLCGILAPRDKNKAGRNKK